MSDHFDELVGEVGDPEERERLHRVHELLLSVDPPAEVVAAVVPLQSRRPQLIAVLAAALALLAFGAGYLLGGDAGNPDAVEEIAMVGSGQTPHASGSIKLLEEDKAGNWPMNVVVRGLAPSRGRGDWYELWLSRDGRLVSPCGRFIVTGARTEVKLTVPYPLRTYDGWVVVRRGSTEPLLTT